MNRFFTLLLAASCLTAVGQSEYCLDGTVWDPTLGGCVLIEDCTLLSDMDQDGLVGLGDLLVLLSEFGLSFQDYDQDGVCDAYDDCVGVVDECGACNGIGPSEVVIEDIIITYDSICLPLDNDWYVFAISADTIFIYECLCPDPVSYQGYDYTTVQIGEQCWFAENLRSENYENGDAIPAGLSQSEWMNTSSGAAAIFGESGGCSSYSPVIDSCDPSQSLSEYGRLYNWYAVDDTRGLCPSGWHVPTDQEWTVLTDFLGGESVAGSKIKTTYGWSENWCGVGNGTNSSGFSGLPGGFRNYTGSFGGSGIAGYWWSSSPEQSYKSWLRVLEHYDDDVDRGSSYQWNGNSIRCIKDSE